ncbi:hypothetical protein R75461_08368 [Paraburkholderia nemoris]|uniref:transposase n=1 Tax=Paraburkholderia nemoris TaxID=2793076 RepID=UPI00190CE0D0|nr:MULTISPECIES: transposase [Paraburkholderia]MBK3787141.1 transposase [Paraburkholderia aspalathi]CAE6867430.1 hypothetical protein R75461_08368 [Paraburkholderia nemoris]
MKFLRPTEHNLHCVLDVTFGEDQCRVRVGNVAQNFAILRRIALDLVKRDTKTKVGLKKPPTQGRYPAEILGW